MGIQVLLGGFDLPSVHGSDFGGIQVNLGKFELYSVHGSDLRGILPVLLDSSYL